MSSTQILVLGAIAGLTIFIGLPVGRLGPLPLGLSALFSATATGILLFLLWDVLSAGIEPVESALVAASDHDGSWARFAGLAAVFVASFAVGLLSLVYFDAFVCPQATEGRIPQRRRGCRDRARRRARRAVARPDRCRC